MELLGSVEREWALSLSPTERARFPQLVAGRIRERPYCMGCFRLRRPSFSRGRRFGRIGLGGDYGSG